MISSIRHTYCGLHYPCHAFLIDLRYDTTRLVELLPLVERLVQANTPTASAIFGSGVNCFCRILRKQNTTMPSLLILLRLYRHLNESQRGMVAAKLETLKHGDNQHTTGDANLHVLTRSDAEPMPWVMKPLPKLFQIALRWPESICWCNCANDSVNRAY